MNILGEEKQLSEEGCSPDSDAFLLQVKRAVDSAGTTAAKFQELYNLWYERPHYKAFKSERELVVIVCLKGCSKRYSSALCIFMQESAARLISDLKCLTVREDRIILVSESC